MAGKEGWGCAPVLLRALVEDSGARYKESGASYVLACPRCGKEKLYVRKSDGHFICWSCPEFKGWAEQVFSEILGLSEREVRRKLGKDGGGAAGSSGFLLELDEPAPGDTLVDDAPPPEVGWPHDFLRIGDPRAVRGAAYLEGRGVPLDVATRYGVRYSPPQTRVGFPVTRDGVLVGYQARLTVPERVEVEGGGFVDVPKVLSSPKLPRDRTLMFEERLDGADHVLLAEGPVSAIKGDLCGGNVATMGKVVSPGQLALLRARGIKRFYLGLDPDAADEVAGLVRDLWVDSECYLVVPDRGSGSKTDLGDLSFCEVRDLFLGAERVDPWRLFLYLG